MMTLIIFFEIEGVTLVRDFQIFTKNSDLIITNRLDDQIQPFSHKVFSRDIFFYRLAMISG